MHRPLRLLEGHPPRVVAREVVVLVVADPVDVVVAGVELLDHVVVPRVTRGDPRPDDVVHAQLPETVVDVAPGGHELPGGAVLRDPGVHLQVEGEEHLPPVAAPAVLLDPARLHVDHVGVVRPGGDLRPPGLLRLGAAPHLALPGQQQHPVLAELPFLLGEELPLQAAGGHRGHVVVRVHDVQASAEAPLVGLDLLAEVRLLVRHERAEPGAAARLEELGGGPAALRAHGGPAGARPDGQGGEQRGADRGDGEDAPPAASARAGPPRPRVARAPRSHGGVRGGGGGGGGGRGVGGLGSGATGEPHGTGLPRVRTGVSSGSTRRAG